MVIWDKNI